MKIFIHDTKTGCWEINETKLPLIREYENAHVTEVKEVVNVAKNKDKKSRKEIKKPKKGKK